jgi:uncharacterized membrane protein
MTISTSLGSTTRETEFFRRPLGSKLQSALTLAAGAALSVVGVVRRDWLGAAIGLGGGYLLYSGISDLRPYQGKVRVAFTVGKTPEEVYDFVRDPVNWNHFLHGAQFGRPEAGRLTIRLGGRDGFTVCSNVQLTDERPGDYIAWASTDETVAHRGVIRFRQAPGSRGTEMSIALEYRAREGPVARGLRAIAGWAPEQMVRESLRHIKQLLEAGEIPTTEGQPVGERGLKGAAVRVLYSEPVGEERQASERLAGD